MQRERVRVFIDDWRGADLEFEIQGANCIYVTILEVDQTVRIIYNSEVE